MQLGGRPRNPRVYTMQRGGSGVLLLQLWCMHASPALVLAGTRTTTSTVLGAAAPAVAGIRSATASGTKYELLDYVDPFIGTGGFGFGVGGDPPGATLPFGCVRASPDTGSPDAGLDDTLHFNHYGGYHHGELDTQIRSFTLTKMVGPGVSDFGNIGIMPVRAAGRLTLATEHSASSRFQA